MSLRAALEETSVTQILSAFKFGVLKKTSFYLLYSCEALQRRYYTFIDPEQHVQIFDPSKFSIIDKVDLFLSLINPRSFPEIEEKIEKIKELPHDDSCLLLSPVDPFTFLNRLAALRKATLSDFALASSPQFQNKVFVTADRALSIPLYSLRAEQERSDKVVNFVLVRNESFSYFNESRDWLTTTNFNPENRFLILTSDPAFFLSHLSATYGPDYFMILCHPNPDEGVFKAILSIMHRLDFSHVSVASSSRNDKHLVAAIFTFFLNAYAENLVFKIHYHIQHYEIIVYSLDGFDHIEFMKNILLELHQRSSELFSASESQLNDNDLKAFFEITEVRGTMQPKKCFSASIKSADIISANFFSLLAHKFGIANRIRLYSDPVS